MLTALDFGTVQKKAVYNKTLKYKKYVGKVV